MGAQTKQNVDYTLLTDRRDGVPRYTLIDEERNSIIVITSYKALIDQVVANGWRSIEPGTPLSVNRQRRL